jgi:hypothetical protein
VVALHHSSNAAAHKLPKDIRRFGIGKSSSSDSREQSEILKNGPSIESFAEGGYHPAGHGARCGENGAAVVRANGWILPAEVEARGHQASVSSCAAQHVADGNAGTTFAEVVRRWHRGDPDRS